MKIDMRRVNAAKNQLIKLKLNLFNSQAVNRAGWCIIILILMSCSNEILHLTDLSDINSIHKRTVLDISDKVEFDSNTGEIKSESRRVIDELSQYLKDNPKVKATVIVHYMNTMERHVELAHTMSGNVYDALIEKGLSKDRLSYEIDLDKNNTYSPFSSNRKVHIILKP